jgi:hypothetical protein
VGKKKLIRSLWDWRTMLWGITIKKKKLVVQCFAKIR